MEQKEKKGSTLGKIRIKRRRDEPAHDVENTTVSEPATFTPVDEKKMETVIEDQPQTLVEKQPVSYIDERLKENWDVINQANDMINEANNKINEIQSSLILANRAVSVLEEIKKGGLSFDVSWLINRIGILKGALQDSAAEMLDPECTDVSLMDPIQAFENEIFNMVEAAINERKK